MVAYQMGPYPVTEPLSLHSCFDFRIIIIYFKILYSFHVLICDEPNKIK